MKRFVLCLLLPLAFLTGCDNPQASVDSLRREIIEYRDAPSEERKAKIEADFAKLQKKVEEMKAKGDAKAAEYARKLDTLDTDYKAARVGKVLDDAKHAIQGFGEALQQGAKDLQESLTKDSTNKESR